MDREYHLKQKRQLAEDEAKWREEYKKLCALADFAGDLNNPRAVFAVEDKSARLALITHLSKLHTLDLTEADLEVDAWKLELLRAKQSADDWPLWPTLAILFWSIASLGLEFLKISPLVGVIATAAIGVLFGLSVRDTRMRHMREAVSEARAKLGQALKRLEDIRYKDELFSSREQRTGEPDTRS